MLVCYILFSILCSSAKTERKIRTEIKNEREGLSNPRLHEERLDLARLSWDCHTPYSLKLAPERPKIIVYFIKDLR